MISIDSLNFFESYDLYTDFALFGFRWVQMTMRMTRKEKRKHLKGIFLKNWFCAIAYEHFSFESL